MTHHYPVRVHWNGGRTAGGSVTLEAASQSEPLAVPREFDGTGAGTSPEELLSASIAACYAMTFGIIAEHRRVPLAQLDVTAVGEVEQDGPRVTYTAITVRPRVLLTADATEDHARQALDIAHRADKYCIITNAVRGTVKVSVEPEIVRG
jgi:peroxiredoxin-like protein